MNNEAILSRRSQAVATYTTLGVLDRAIGHCDTLDSTLGDTRCRNRAGNITAHNRVDGDAIMITEHRTNSEGGDEE